MIQNASAIFLPSNKKHCELWPCESGNYYNTVVCPIGNNDRTKIANSHTKRNIINGKPTSYCVFARNSGYNACGNKKLRRKKKPTLWINTTYATVAIISYKNVTKVVYCKRSGQPKLRRKRRAVCITRSCSSISTYNT